MISVCNVFVTFFEQAQIRKNYDLLCVTFLLPFGTSTNMQERGLSVCNVFAATSLNLHIDVVWRTCLDASLEGEGTNGVHDPASETMTRMGD
jgi:hypothetical protein